jgi:tetratricopeptide (TPR) repeat protein
MRIFSVVLVFGLFGPAFAEIRDSLRGRMTMAQEQSKTVQELVKANAPAAEVAQAKVQYKAAVQDLAAEGAKTPNDGAAQAATGRALVDLGEQKSARPFVERTIELGRKNGNAQLEAEGLSLLAESQFQQGEFSGAIDSARAALELAPGNKGALFILHASAGRGGDAGAESGRSPSTPAALDARVDRADVATTSAQALRSQTLVREAQGRMAMDPAAAAPLIEAALKLDPNNAAALLVRARLRRTSGDWAGAWADADLAVTLDGASTAAHALRAELGAALGRKEEEVRGDFLASGRAEENFKSFYAEQATKSLPPTSVSAAAARVGFWAAPFDWVRAPAHRSALLIRGIGLIFFAGALLFMTKRRAGDGRD